jgi:hypothetical protein
MALTVLSLFTLGLALAALGLGLWLAVWLPLVTGRASLNDLAFGLPFVLQGLGQAHFLLFTHGLHSADGATRQATAQRLQRWALLLPSLYGALLLNVLVTVFVVNEVWVFVRQESSDGWGWLWGLPLAPAACAVQNGVALRRRVPLPPAE